MFQKIILFIAFSSFLFSWGQPEKVTSEWNATISVQADFFWGSDGLGNYFYSKDNVLFKKNNEGIIQYQNLPLGPLKHVDITNPLRPVLLYESFNTVVLLDNFLNEIQTLAFSELPNPILVNGVGMSNQNRLWVYDASLQQIGLFPLSSPTVQWIGNPVQGNWHYYQCSFNSFDWIDAQNHWKSMTIYGQISDYGEVPQGVVQLLDNQNVCYNEGDQLFIKSLKTGKSFRIEIVEKSIKKVYWKEQILSIFTDKGITNYKITLP